MGWKTVRIEQARTPEFPEGAPSRAYLLHLPLGDDALIDLDAFRASPERATVRRLWPDEPEQSGRLVHTRHHT